MSASQLELSNLDKLYWQKENITKAELIQYYATITPYILPHLKNRPMILHRYPHGIEGESFYQKNIEHYPPFVKTVVVQHERKKTRYMLIQNDKSLLFAANLGCIEMHPFLSTFKKLDKPSYLIFDLDPEDIAFDAVVETAITLHEILSQYKIPHCCKTSGKTGLHIYVPLKQKYTYDQIKEVAMFFAEMAHKKLPETTSLERLPKKRQKKVYIDCLQNRSGQSVAAPYSVRAEPFAPVSTPLEWSEVKEGLDPLQFTLRTVPERLAKKGDLFLSILGKGVDFLTLLKKMS